MPKIFISYRRADSGDIAGRIADRLKASFGVNNVFYDVTSIGFGDEFKKIITDYLSKSDIVLVIIGEKWASLKDNDTGQTRLHMANDVVHYEVEMALNRSDAKVIPVLVNTDNVPDRRQLPESIQQLINHNFAYVKTARFDGDMQLLIESLDPNRIMRRIVAGVAVLLTIMIVIAGLLYFSNQPPDEQATAREQTIEAVEATPEVTESPSDTATIAPSNTETAVSTNTATETPSPTETDTPIPTDTPITPTATVTALPSNTATNVPVATNTPVIIRNYPCEGTVINPDSGATVINVVYLQASTSSQRGRSLRIGDTVTIQRQTTENNQDWYLIFDGAERIGYVFTRYVEASLACPT